MGNEKLDIFREKYPKYKDIPDDKLAEGIYKSFYEPKGRSEKDFYSSIGLESPSSKASRESSDSIDSPVDTSMGKYSEVIAKANEAKTPAGIASTLTPDGSEPKVDINTIINPNKNIDIPEVPTLRTSTEAMSDTFHAIGAGVGGVVKSAGTISGLVTGNMDNPISKFGSEMQQDFKDQYSSQKKQWDKEDREKIDSQDGELNKALQVLKNYASTPQNVVLDVAEQIPQIGAMLVGGTGTKVTAETLGATPKIASKIGTIGATVTEAGLSGADSADDTYSAIMKLPDTVWNNSPAYQELIKNGIEPSKAKEAIALEESRYAAGKTGALTFGLNKFMPHGDMIEKALVGDVSSIATKGTVGKIAGIGSETAIEGIDESQSKINSNMGIKNIDSNQDILSGVGEAGAKGAVLGGVTSGGITIAESLTPKTTEQKKQMIEDELAKSINNTDLSQEDILNKVHPNQAYYQQQNQESQNINNSPTPTETPIINKQLENVTQGFEKLQEEIKANNEKPIEELLQKDLEVKVADEPTPNSTLDNNIIPNQEVQNQDSTLLVSAVEKITNQDTINQGENTNISAQTNEVDNNSIPQINENRSTQIKNDDGLQELNTEQIQALYDTDTKKETRQQIDNVIKMYQEELVKNPDNKNAEEMLSWYTSDDFKKQAIRVDRAMNKLFEDNLTKEQDNNIVPQNNENITNEVQSLDKKDWVLKKQTNIKEQMRLGNDIFVYFPKVKGSTSTDEIFKIHPEFGTMVADVTPEQKDKILNYLVEKGFKQNNNLKKQNNDIINQDNKGNSNDTNRPSSLEQNSRNTGNTKPDIKTNNDDGSKSNVTDDRQNRDINDGENEVTKQSSNSVSASNATIGGEQSNKQLPKSDETGRPKTSSTRNINTNRSSSSDDARTQAEQSTVSDTTESSPRPREEEASSQALERGFNELTFKEKLAKQEAAESIDVKIGDLENIEQTLPVLLKPQMVDVLKAEKRFFEVDENDATNGKGILFTNGTGTGKTYTGLGIIKRFIKSNKERVLIVVPTDVKAKDWIEDGKNVKVDISQLESIQDSGNGVVITTYANFYQNENVHNENWDLVVYDESHYLMANQGGEITSTTEAHFKTTKSIKSLMSGIYKDDNNYSIKLEDAKKESSKTKVVFLSATPFKSHKSLRYADGYLFNIGDGSRVGGYNAGSEEDNFFITNFGYKMRYNKLTRPDKEVNLSYMERKFANSLMDKNILSGRSLKVDADYSREFIDIMDNDKFQDALNLLFDHKNKDYENLRKYARQRFYSYLESSQLYEAMKANYAISRIKEHLALGRKIVVFHKYKSNPKGVSNPFDLSDSYYTRIVEEKGIKRQVTHHIKDDIKALEELKLFKRKTNFESIFNGYENTVDTLKKEFKDKIVFFNGEIPKSKRKENIQKFNDDNVDIIVVQEQAGKEGISLHDIKGDKQRVLINLGIPDDPIAAIQIEGRIYRTGVKSNAIYEYPTLGISSEAYIFGSKINERVGTVENLALGDKARALKEQFKIAYENTHSDTPHYEQGQGGKELDINREVLNPYDNAISDYFANAKGKKNNLGKDYFATPEPLGLKMVEWANIAEGEDALEPSVGHGAIGKFFPEYSNNTFVEQSYSLADKAAININGNLIRGSFEDLSITNKFDSIVMNPPFGVGGKTAMEHIEKAFDKHLRNNGRIVALIPDGPAMQKRLDKWLYEEDKKGNLLRNATLVADIKLPIVTFERAGTTIASRVIILDKAIINSDFTKELDLRNTDNINDLFEKIKDISIIEKVRDTNKRDDTMYSRRGRVSMPNNPIRLTGKESIRPTDGIMNLRDKEITLPDKFEPMTPAKIRKQVIDIIGNRLYFSKIKQKAEGFYRKKTGETRIKEINNVEVYAHEMAHYLDFYNGNRIFRNAYKDTRFKDEVERFSYTDANDLKGIEGFAEFVRAWLTQYEYAKEKAPNFTKEFERILAETKLDTKMNQLQEDMHKWYNQGDEAMFSALIGDKKSKLDWFKEVIFNVVSYVKNHTIVSLLDRGHGFSLAEFTMFGELQKGSNSATKLLRLALGGHTGVYESIIKFGTPKLTDRGDLTFSGKGLSEIFSPVLGKGNKEDIQNFKELMEYFAAVQANEMMIQGKKTPFSQSQINTILQRGEQKPIYKKVFQEYQDFNNRMLDWYVQMDYLTPEDIENFKSKNSVYVPMQRIIESMEQGDGYSGGFFGRKGSDRNIRDIERNITEQLFHHVKGAMIAKAKSTLFNQLNNHEDGSLFAVRLSSDAKKIKVNIEQQAKKIVEVLYDAGMMLDNNGDIVEVEDNTTLEEAINNTIDILIMKPQLMTFISFGNKPKNTGSHIEEVIINGERKYFEVQKGDMGDILNITLNNLGGFQTGWFLNFLSKIKNFETRSITAMPQFKFPNFVRDTMEAQVFSKHGAVNPLKGLLHYYQESDSYKHFMLNGGGYGTKMDGTKNVNPINIFYGSKIEKYDRLMNGDEYANRIAAAENAIEAGDNWIEAAFQGRDITTDFSMTGTNSTLRAFHKVTTFYQANVNSFYKLIRAIKDEGYDSKTYFKATALLTARGMTYLAPIAILSFLSNVIFGDDDDREKYKSLTADEMARFSYINIYGTDASLTLPVAHATGFLFVKIPEYLLNMAFNKNGIVENKYQDAVKFAMLNQVLPIPTTGVFGAVFQHMQNKNFLGSPIISASVEGRKASDQYLPNTPLIYKEFGKVTGLSPLLTQHYSRALFGYMETAMAGAAQIALWDKNKWGEMPYSSSKDYTQATFFKQFWQNKEDKRTVYTEEYYKYREKIKEASNTLLGAKKNKSIDKGERYKELAEDKEFMKVSKLNKQIEKVDMMVARLKDSEEKIYFDNKLTAKEKEQKIEQLYKQDTDALKKVYIKLHPILKEVK